MTPQTGTERSLRYTQTYGRDQDFYAADDVIDSVFIHVTRIGQCFRGTMSVGQFDRFSRFPVRTPDGTKEMRLHGTHEHELARSPLAIRIGGRPTFAGLMWDIAESLLWLTDEERPDVDAEDGRVWLGSSA